MARPEDTRDYLKAAGGELADELGRHLSEEEIVDYCADRIDAEIRQRAQSHLARCSACLAAYKDVRDFFEPARDGERAPDRVEIEREWERFEQRLNPRATNILEWRLPRIAISLAAMLAIALVLTVFWALKVSRERDALAGLAQSQNHAATQLADLEQQNGRLRTEADKLSKQVAELRAPQLGVPIYDVFSRTVRSGEQDTVNRVSVPAEARSVFLILNGEGQPKFSRYGIEIVDSSGKTVWRGSGLRRDSFGNFPVSLDRSFLAPGRYRFRLSGETGAATRFLTEYVVELRTGPTE